MLKTQEHVWVGLRGNDKEFDLILSEAKSPNVQWTLRHRSRTQEKDHGWL